MFKRLRPDKMILFVLLALGTSVTAEEEIKRKPGQTIFANSKRASLKVMRDISKSLGVKCTHCHVKKGSKVQYEIDTENKETTRAMKFGFIDRLVAKGKSSVEYVHDGKTVRVHAILQREGNEGEKGIYLSKITKGEKGEITVKKRVALPEKGKVLNCKTCHMGQVHIFEHAKNTH